MLDQIHHQHHRGIHHTGDGPDEPAVLGLTVAGGAEGVPHEEGRHQQPVDGADRALDAAAGLILAGVVYGLSMIFYSRAAAALGSSQLMYIYNANLFVSMIFATLLLGEKITPKKLIGALLMIAALFI